MAPPAPTESRFEASVTMEATNGTQHLRGQLSQSFYQVGFGVRKNGQSDHADPHP
jgi:hypothetical protein